MITMLHRHGYRFVGRPSRDGELYMFECRYCAQVRVILTDWFWRGI